MQVGEQGVLRSEAGALGGQWLLDFDDQLGGREHLGGIGDHPGPGRRIVRVAEADGRTGLTLHPHRMAVATQLGYRRGGEADAILVVLDLSGDTDAHDRSP